MAMRNILFAVLALFLFAGQAVAAAPPPDSPPVGCPFLSPCNLAAASAGANILTLTDPNISNASNTFSFGPSVFTSPAELVESNNVSGQNVHVFQNTNPNGFSAWTARGDENVEHMAGGTSGSSASYLEAGGLVDYLEISHYVGNVPGYVKASFTASITGTVMTVTGSPTGTLAVGQHVYEAAFGTITQNTRIVSLGTGTGGAGTYNLNISQTQSSQAMISAFTPPDFFIPQTGTVNGVNGTFARFKMWGAPYGQAGFSSGHLTYYNDSQQEILGVDPAANSVDANFHLVIGNNNSAFTPTANDVIDVVGNACIGNQTTGRSGPCASGIPIVVDTTSTSLQRWFKVGEKSLNLDNTGTGATYTVCFKDFDNSAVTPLCFPLDGTGNITVAGTVKVSGIASDSGKTDTTVCQDTTNHQLFSGSGTLGICLGTSSVRFKRDWEPLNDGLDQVLALNPGNYFYKQGYGDNGAREQYGFLAEDTISVLPKLTALDAEGKPNSVDILGMVPVIVRAVQQQQAEIEGKAAIPMSEASEIAWQAVQIKALAAWCALLTGWILIVTVRRRTE